MSVTLSSEEGTRLSRLVTGGVEGVRIVFGAAGEPVPAVELAARGVDLFSERAEAGVIGVLMTNDRATVEVVLGAVLAGARLVSLPLPGRGTDLDEYTGFLRAICDEQDIGEVVAADDLAVLLAGVGLPVRTHAALRSRPLAVPQPEDFELVQFTSGSTRQPRAVALGDPALGANVAAVLEVVRPRPGDALVSWLPLAHDMGLVGMLLTGLAAGGTGWTGGGDIVLLDPREFLRRPAVWMEALSRWRGAFTAAPDFAFRLATERRAASELDLSCLRCAIVGGEIVRADTLTAFTEAYRGHGADPVALCPAYGMAELGLAATLTPPELHWRDLTVVTAALAENQVDMVGRTDPSSLPGAGTSAPVEAPPTSGGPGGVTSLVASGPPLPGYEVAVWAAVSGETDPAPDRRNGIGRLAVRGPSLGADGSTGKGFSGPDGWFRTGDAGFVEDGWLYVCGRVDDWVVAHGRNLYAPAVEAAVGDVDGVRAGRVTAVGLPSGDWVVVAEPASRSPLRAPETAGLRRSIRRAAVDVAATRPDEVVVVAPGSLPLTSSGKLQRHEVRARLLKGELIDAAAAAT